MRLILDTHVFLWFIQGSSKLSDTAQSAIENTANQKFISTASLWEMAIKMSAGKLEVGMPLLELVQTQIYGNTFQILTIDPEHLNQVISLPFHHKDPFDRLIISQSLVEGISIVSKDRIFEEYPIQLIW